MKIKTAIHGTRSMYVHHGCRCDACCRAEHAQYLKRKESQNRKRTNSKWESVEYTPGSNRLRSQSKHNRQRYIEFKSQPSTHTRPICRTEIAPLYENKCALCGCMVDPNDKWIGRNGRMCYGRRYPTVDHIVPLRHGGSDTIENVQLLCKHCNSQKGARTDAAVYSEQKRQQTGATEKTA